MTLTAKKWKVFEYIVTAEKAYVNPFWDVSVNAVFTHIETGLVRYVTTFYDGIGDLGRQIWKARWTPDAEGLWHCKTEATSGDSGLASDFNVQVEKAEAGSKGFLRVYPKQPWGFRFDDGTFFFLFGDTMYNLFGAHACGIDIKTILMHRKKQGINYIRTRAQVSPYHPEVSNQWQTHDLWPWGGSIQWPEFTRLNLDYFRAVDQVVELMQSIDMGLEFIFEAWMLEFPFNDRGRFLPEHEMLWIEYLVARYAAYPSIYIWNPSNEYEFYPGTAKYHPEADEWLARLARFIKEKDPVRHPVGAHNWVQNIPLCDRLGKCRNIDVYLVQTDWGAELAHSSGDLSMCRWIEKHLHHHAPLRDKTVLCAEFGYEKADGCYTVCCHERMDHHHTRRGQWRAGFSGYMVVHGFNNTWGAHMRVDVDAKGATYLRPYYDFMTKELRFETMRPAPEILISSSGSIEEGNQPLCLADDYKNKIAVYFPAAGSCEIQFDSISNYVSCWMNPRNESRTELKSVNSQKFSTEAIAAGEDEDWVLILTKVHNNF